MGCRKDAKFKIGDVIKSKSFEFGYFNPQCSLVSFSDRYYIIPKNLIAVGIKVKGIGPQLVKVAEEERVKIAARTGRITPKNRMVNYQKDDKSRAKAEVVVTEVIIDGREGEPIYCGIVARRLTPNGKYDPKGEVIGFYLTGVANFSVPSSSVTVDLSEVVHTRTMKQVFI